MFDDRLVMDFLMSQVLAIKGCYLHSDLILQEINSVLDDQHTVCDVLFKRLLNQNRGRKWRSVAEKRRNQSKGKKEKLKLKHWKNCGWLYCDMYILKYVSDHFKATISQVKAWEIAAFIENGEVPGSPVPLMRFIIAGTFGTWKVFLTLGKNSQ